MHLQQATAPPFRSLPAPPAPGPEKPGSEIHLVSLIDASEEVIEPFAVACMENLERAKSNSNGHLDGTVVLQRSGVPPGVKKMKGHLASTAPRAVGLGLGIAAGAAFGAGSLVVPVIGGVLGGVIGGAVGLAVGGLVGDLAFGRTQLLKHIPYNGAEPYWGGSRTYELARNKTDAIDSPITAQDPSSKKLDAGAMGELMGQEMAANPRDLSVAHVLGHGLAFREAAGMDFGAYRAMLSQATTLAGRPVDLLLVESCLGGNLESLLATAPYARYAVVSEEVTSAGSVSGAFARAVKTTAGHAVTPRQLGQAVIAHNDRGQERLLRAFFGIKPKELDEQATPEEVVRSTSAETLALVDMSKVEALGQAVDTLGGLLVTEIESGNVRPIRAAVEMAVGTGEPMMVLPKQSLGVGDLNVFVNGLGELLDSGLMSSPQPRALHQGLVDVQKKLADVVVSASIAPEYADSAGLTVQLPTRLLGSIEQSHPQKMSNSAMPPRWREFVELASQRF